MGKVIVITSGKGGVGKTTVTANLGAGLAQMGKRVVIIDADIGLRNLDLVMGLENRIIFDIVDVVEKKCRSYRQALIKDKRFSNLFLLPAAQSRDKSAVTPEQMIDLCETIKEHFEYVLIDCPAGIEHGFQNAIAGCDEAIIVTNPEVSAVRDADRIIGILESQEKYDPKLLINRLKPELVKKGRMLGVDDIQETLSIELLGIIPEDEGVINSTNKGEPIILNKFSKAGSAYRQVVAKILDPSLEVALIGDNGSLWERIKRFFIRNKVAS